MELLGRPGVGSKKAPGAEEGLRFVWVPLLGPGAPRAEFRVYEKRQHVDTHQRVRVQMRVEPCMCGQAIAIQATTDEGVTQAVAVQASKAIAVQSTTGKGGAQAIAVQPAP